MPKLAEGLRLKLPEAILSLRQHLEALNSVCNSLEKGQGLAPRAIGDGRADEVEAQKVGATTDDGSIPGKPAGEEDEADCDETQVPESGSTRFKSGKFAANGQTLKKKRLKKDKTKTEGSVNGELEEGVELLEAQADPPVDPAPNKDQL